jgi:hypothetical protein
MGKTAVGGVAVVHQRSDEKINENEKGPGLAPRPPFKKLLSVE